MSELRITESKLHQYLADAYKRGADQQRDFVMPVDYERRVRESEAWAREYISLRLENGILALLDESEPVDEELLSGLGDAADILGEIDVQAAEYVRSVRDRLASPTTEDPK